MAWIFGDGFDVYATVNDPVAGYWDSGAVASMTLGVGRFTGSQCIRSNNNAVTHLVKSSGVNDAVHHIICAYNQTAVLSGSNVGWFLQLSDAATNQVCVCFRQDGAILLTSATYLGTVLATYTGAVTAANTWFAFEFEVVIHPTAGSFTVRKNGNPANDFTATSLNTRPGTNSYANKLSIGVGGGINVCQLDDVLWRSDAASVAWMGDIRCYTRMPASDASVQFSKSPATTTQGNITAGTLGILTGTSKYSAPFTALYDCTIGSVIGSLATGYTGNMKCSIFASVGAGPLAVLGSATPVTNPATGNNTFTFGTPVVLAKGAQYIVGFSSDTSSGSWNITAGTAGYTSTTVPYASFPQASPTTSGIIAQPVFTANLTVTSNNSLVNETLQDGTTTYVYDSTIGHADFYNIAPLSVTPATVIAVVTRGFVEKSDAGFRSGAVQLKSGGSTVAASTLNLATSFLWSWRVDLTDPNTSAAWTPVAVNSVQIGPTVIG
jgi:hypothetical protein